MKKIARILLLAGALIFLIQTSVTPLIHNHPEDLHAHYDCPAYILSITLQTFAFTFLIIFALKAPFAKQLPLEQKIQSIKLVQHFKFGNRAPPL